VVGNSPPVSGTIRETLRATRGSARPPDSSIPRSVWLITVLFGLLLLLFSVLFPTYRGPDEPQHVDLILAVRHDLRYPEFDERFVSRPIVDSLRLVRFAGLSRNLTEQEAIPRSRRPSFSELGPDEPSDMPNQMPQHPPLYYALMGAVSAGVSSLVPGSESWSFDRVVALLRLLNVVLLLPLPLISFLVARRLQWTPHAAVGASVVPLAIPELTHIGSVVNNDNLLTLLIAVLTLLLVKAATGDSSTATAVWIGIIGGLALLTKGFALFVPLWVAAAYLLSPDRVRGRLVVRRLGLAIAVSAVVGGWWWLRNIILFETVQPGLAQTVSPSPGFEPRPVWWAGAFVWRMVQRFWGWFGWFDVKMSTIAIVTATAVALVAIVVAFVRGGRPWSRAHLMLLLAPVFGIALIVAYGAYGVYRRGGHGGIQGRYLFPGVVGLAVLIALGLTHALGRRGRFAPALLLIGAALMQLAAVRTIVHFYWGPRSPTRITDRLQAMLAWSPWPGPVVLAAGALVAVVGIWALAEFLRSPGSVSESSLTAGS
jgi:small subunit ribosomal protein S36